MQKSDFESEVGSFWGFGGGVNWDMPAWAPAQVTIIQADVKAGLRRWYYCGHSWSFMKPFMQANILQGTSTLTMPDDFGGVDGGEKACLTNTSLLFLQWIPFTGPGRVLQALSNLPNAVGITRLVSIRPLKAMVPGKMQQSELYFFPVADQNYVLTFPYFFTPGYLLDTTQPFAFGGIDHHEAIKEACLSVAEARRGDAVGFHASEFQRLLALSIQIDRRKQPTNLGQNLDRSDWRGDWIDRWNGHGWGGSGGGVTINGAYFD